MRIGLVRSLLALVTTLSVAFMAQASPAQSAGTFSAGDGTLFALQGVGTIVRVDAASGALSVVADVSSVVPGGSVTSLVASSSSATLYANTFWCSACGKGGVGFPMSQVVSVNSRTGAMTASPARPAALGYGVTLDPSTGVLYGVTTCFGCATQIVRVDPVTGLATSLATLPVQWGLNDRLAVAPGSHILYAAFGTELFAIDISNDVVSPEVPLVRPVDNIAIDTASGRLFGVTSGFPSALVAIDVSTGAETTLASFGLLIAKDLAIDPRTHTAFTSLSNGFGSASSQVASVSDETGAGTIGAPTTGVIDRLAFQPTVTPDSIIADVRNALGSGMITNSGVANSLLGKLDAASDARAHNLCGTAANIYRAFINELEAQSGKAISPATATWLADAAQYLEANCP